MPLIHQWAQQAGYAGAGAYLMVGMVGCPCTLAITGGLGRFVAPLCRREAVYDEDLLLRGLWKLCTVNCPSADKPRKTIKIQKEAGDYESPASFFLPHHRESRPYGKNTRTAHAAAMKAAASAASAAGTVWRVRRMPAAP